MTGYTSEEVAGDREPIPLRALKSSGIQSGRAASGKANWSTGAKTEVSTGAERHSRIFRDPHFPCDVVGLSTFQPSLLAAFSTYFFSAVATKAGSSASRRLGFDTNSEST